MAMRNWWIEAYIDGRKHPLTGGPREKEGSFDMDIYQRVNGTSVRVAVLEGRYIEGRLELQMKAVTNEPGVEISSLPSYNNKITMIRSQR